MKDYLVRGMSMDGFVKCVAIRSTDIVTRGAQIHGTTPNATAAFGRALTAAAMMGNTQKVENGSMTLQIRGGGPIGTITCVSDATGNVRGTMTEPKVPLVEKYPGKLDVGATVGVDGTLTVIRDLQMKEPYVGSTELISGEIGDDVTAYFAQSEQTPTACALGVLVDRDQSVKVAGGYIIQLLPGAGEDVITKVEGGVLLRGDLVAMINYIGQILIELVKLANLVVLLSKAMASLGRVEQILDTEPSMTFDGTETGTDTETILEFRNAGLRYRGAGAESLSGISFALKKGQTLGIIGGTGSGKSTLVSLIPRFYDATEGKVLLKGVPIGDLKEEVLRKTVAVVQQKAQLFAGTIRSNLLWGNEQATDAELWQALETAQAGEFVREKGLDATVEQGGRNLSGGQKQRLTIARALVAKPEILILDDSASALDYATDAALRSAIRRMPGDMTVVIVSQRTASIQHADQILVLDDGLLVGQGSHETLLRTCPVYREIHESQFRKEEA
mgnify:CR=1 FL=1